MSDGHGASPGERRGGRQPGSKNIATRERESLISQAIGELKTSARQGRPRRGDDEVPGPRGGHPWRFRARHVRRVLASVAEKSK